MQIEIIVRLLLVGKRPEHTETEAYTTWDNYLCSQLTKLTLNKENIETLFIKVSQTDIKI
jgi:hypothetical protein